MEEQRAVQKRWTSSEELTLIDLVLSHENELFGCHKGPVSSATGRTEQRRAALWAEIADKFNSRSSNEKRGVEKIKKKFHNIKQRAKEKIDNARRSKRQTGGGPQAPVPTPAEEALLQVFGERPGMQGLTGVDTDVPTTLSSASLTVAASTASAAASTTATSSTAAATSSTAAATSSTAAATSTTAAATSSTAAAATSSTAAATSSTTAATSSTTAAFSTSSTGKRRKLDRLDEATLENIKIDNIRMQGAIKVQEQKLKSLKSQQTAFDSLNMYLQLKMASEFNLTFETED